MDSDDKTLKRSRETAPEQQSRKRARQSCETCKARKTRCIGGETGACQYCESLGIACEVNLKNRKRPFYKVSEEVYDYSIKLLRRFVPQEELPELTVGNIKAILERLDNGLTPPPLVQSDTFPRETDSNAACPPPQDNGGNQEMVEADEHPLLQQDMGCIVLDSMGKYRYVGADSSLRWNHAARMASDKSASSDPRIIIPLKTGLLPPTTPESAISHHRGEVYLPCRQLCMNYVARFFEQVHCMHWFYSPEQFYTLLDQTLEDRGTTASSSWLCSLYSIFALGSMRQRPTSTLPKDNKQTSDYLMLAKELSPAVADEADIESVKAFGLLSLAMHAMCYSVAAYLHLGTAVRIGFSLGLHHNIFPRTRASMERERSTRVWWTIYVLDHEMASRLGYPCAIIDDASFINTSPASELILDPGPNMPLGYQTLSVSLAKLRKKISFECFLEPTHSGGRLPINRVTKSLSGLKEWLDNVPPHLRWDSSLPLQHRRSAAVLHLRYWTSVISVTRPFLLFSVARSAAIRHPAKRKCYQELSGTCINAAEISVQIVNKMREDKILSSVTLNDCHCIGEVMWVLILALQKKGSPEHQDMLKFCLETVSSMERIGWCEKIVPDLEGRVYESGVLELQSRQQHQEPTNLEVAQEFLDFNFDGSQLDVFETLDFETRAGLMDIFSQAPLGSMESLF